MSVNHHEKQCRYKSVLKKMAFGLRQIEDDHGVAHVEAVKRIKALKKKLK